MTYKQVVDCYSGSKKKVYYRALVNLVTNGLQKHHTYVKMFIKPDRWPANEIRQKAPRAIQYRSAEFNLVMASYLKPIEDTIYDRIRPFGTRVVAKGLNLRQRGVLFEEKIRKFRRPYFVSLDHSKFDSTVNMTHLKQLHKLYRRIAGKEVQRILKYQYYNKCYTKSGIKYRSTATRCSGDFDTGLGNTLINIACILQVCEGMVYDFMLDGDDAVLIVEKGLPSLEKFEKFGFRTEFTVTPNKHLVEFCHSRLIYNDGPLFVRDPIRAISNNMAGRIKYDLKGFARYMAGLGVGEYAVSSGVPILHYQADRLRKIHHNPIFSRDNKWKMLNLAREELAINVEARISFAEAWGIPYDMQLMYESKLLPLSLQYRKACSGYTESLIYDAEQLYRAWTRMATLDLSSGASRCGVG